MNCGLMGMQELEEPELKCEFDFFFLGGGGVCRFLSVGVRP